MPAGLDLDRVAVDPPRDAAHGEAATNAALVLAKAAGQPPMAIAGLLVEALAGHPDVTNAEPAAPGFVNLTMRRLLAAAGGRGARRGRATMGAARSGRRRRSMSSSVRSIRPGPLHAGHGRGTVFGDALA